VDAKCEREAAILAKKAARDAEREAAKALSKEEKRFAREVKRCEKLGLPPPSPMPAPRCSALHSAYSYASSEDGGRCIISMFHSIEEFLTGCIQCSSTWREADPLGCRHVKLHPLHLLQAAAAATPGRDHGGGGAGAQAGALQLGGHAAGGGAPEAALPRAPWLRCCHARRPGRCAAQQHSYLTDHERIVPLTAVLLKRRKTLYDVQGDGSRTSSSSRCSSRISPSFPMTAHVLR
jgi:hypothetical protein